MREIWRIIRYSKQLWRYYVAIAALVVIISLLNLAAPFLTKLIVDQLVAQVTGQAVELAGLGWLVLLILLSDLAITLLSNVQGYLGDMMSERLHTYLSGKYYQHVLSLPLEYYDNEISGKITGRLERSISTITNLMQTLANNFVQFGLTAVVTLVVIAFYSWPVALFLAVLIPTYIWISHLSSRAWIAKQEAINRHKDQAIGRFLEAIGQIRVVKAFVQEQAEWRFWQARRRQVEHGAQVQSVEWHRYDVWRRVVLNLLFFAISAFIVWETFRRRFSIGEMTLLLALANQVRFPLFGASFIIDAMQRAQAGSRDFFAVMAIRPAILDQSGAKPLRVEQGEVEFKGVEFAYQGGNRVLTDINFKIGAGQKLALVGESGEGKTTISNLLLRLYEPSAGQILIDVQDISQVSQASLRQKIGVVFQDPALFSGSVKENIAYGLTRVKPADLEQAARVANAHGFISRLPQGYDTQIGERGVKLSGGQKQRIAIARAILKNPPLLVLDEATSSLDSRAEREVQAALEKLMRGRTTLIIAHRLSTIQNVDIIVGLKHGRVAEAGSPAALAAGDGIYAELLRLQSPTRANEARLKQFEIAAV